MQVFRNRSHRCLKELMTGYIICFLHRIRNLILASLFGAQPLQHLRAVSMECAAAGIYVLSWHNKRVLTYEILEFEIIVVLTVLSEYEWKCTRADCDGDLVIAEIVLTEKNHRYVTSGGLHCHCTKDWNHRKGLWSVFPGSVIQAIHEKDPYQDYKINSSNRGARLEPRQFLKFLIGFAEILTREDLKKEVGWTSGVALPNCTPFI